MIVLWMKYIRGKNVECTVLDRAVLFGIVALSKDILEVREWACGDMEESIPGRVKNMWKEQERGSGGWVTGNQKAKIWTWDQRRPGRGKVRTSVFIESIILVYSKIETSSDLFFKMVTLVASEWKQGPVRSLGERHGYLDKVVSLWILRILWI